MDLGSDTTVTTGRDILLVIIILLILIVGQRNAPLITHIVIVNATSNNVAPTVMTRLGR